MDKKATSEILKQYDEQAPSLRLFADRLRSMIEEILLSNDLHAHSITCRVKERDSLEKKITRPDKNYESLARVTDLVGVRIITYFADDVDIIARVIEKEFEIDRENSVDKRALLDPDRFGYLSLHYVLKLSATRRAMAEYKRLPDAPAEIQIRSILQHAWAEMEHDLGYKTRLGVPSQTRRRFSRLAGLLELADVEFKEIRKELTAYEKDLPSKIEHEPADVDIDKISLRMFIGSSPIVKALDQEILDAVNASSLEMTPDPTLESDIKRLARLNIRTIQQLDQALSSQSDKIIRFSKHWLRGLTYPSMISGISLLYLLYVLAAQINDESKIKELLDSWNIGGSKDRSELARRVIETYNAAVSKRN